jgi:hypothetical protein
MMMFLVIMFGFSAAYYVTFGAEVARFRSLGDAMGALMRMLLGDFNYDELSNANGSGDHPLNIHHTSTQSPLSIQCTFSERLGNV